MPTYVSYPFHKVTNSGTPNPPHLFSNCMACNRFPVQILLWSLKYAILTSFLEQHHQTSSNFWGIHHTQEICFIREESNASMSEISEFKLNSFFWTVTHSLKGVPAPPPLFKACTPWPSLPSPSKIFVFPPLFSVPIVF